MKMLAWYTCLSEAESAAVKAQGVILQMTLQLLVEVINNKQFQIPVTTSETQTEEHEMVVEYNLASLLKATNELYHE